MTDQEFYNELVTEVCEEVGIPPKSLADIARDGPDEDAYYVNIMIAIRKRGRFLVASNDVNAERVMNKAKFAGRTLAPMFASHLEQRRKGMGMRVFETAYRTEDAIPEVKVMKDLTSTNG